MTTKGIHMLREQCLICEKRDLEPLLFGYSRYNPRLFRKIAICRDCGHIQVYPLFTQTEYAVINDRFFGRQYMVDGKENVTGNIEKLRKIDEGLSPFVHDGLDVLDVGAGEAWLMEYFQRKHCNYCAIEPVERLAGLIRERGGRIIGKNICDDLSKYDGKFDIIVFRHILEHLLNPREALARVGGLLAPDGLVYISLPNAAAPSIRKGFRTSFIRPVHISYFCEGNVHRLADSVGLCCIQSEAIGEIVCLFRRGLGKRVRYENNYTRQKQVFLRKAKEARIKDLGKIVRDITRGLAKRLVGGWQQLGGYKGWDI